MKYWRIGIAGMAITVLGSLFYSQHSVSALYSTGQINDMLSRGVATANDWDARCKNYLSGYRGSNFNSNGGGVLRTAINNGAAYQQESWLSSRGRGNTITPITVNTTDKNLGLQINDAMFLCGPLVNADIAGINAFSCRTNVYGSNIVDDGSRWVTPWDANDRRPNAFGGGCMYPAQAMNAVEITSLGVIGDSTYQNGSVTNPVGSMIWKSRDENSRYWFGNTIPLTYTPKGGFTQSGTVVLRMTYKEVRFFHGTTIRSAVKGCPTDGGGWVWLDPNIGDVAGIKNAMWQCGNSIRDFAVSLQLRQQFTLTPTITVTPSSASDDVAMTITPKVQNAGPTATLDSPGWRVTKFIVEPGKSYAPIGAVKNASDPCVAVSGYKAGSCQTVKSNNQNFPVGSTDLGAFNENTGSLPLGTKICYLLSVRPYKDNVDQWSHTAPGCTIISKQPKAQIWGGDLTVGRRFSGDTSKPRSIVETSTSVKSGGSTFGSWVEYGIFAPSTIAGVGSAAALAGPTGNPSSSQQLWSKLTFANGGQLDKTTDCNGTVKFGCFANPGGMGAIPDVVGRLAPGAAGTPLGGSVSLDGLGSGTYYANSSLRINASTIAKGKSVIIKARDTVFIDGDIKYTTEQLHSLGDIPQVVIIANNIQIKDTVTNVDAWLIANGAQGVVYTCNNNNFTQDLTGSICKDKLTINGPVMAKKLFLTRTAGSGTGAASGDPAEILNLRADAYLWAINRAGGQGSVRTLGTTELAPRF